MCLNPQKLLPVYRPDKGFTYVFVGTKETDFSGLLNPETGEYFEPFDVGCGKCTECINLHKVVWQHRLEDEKKCHDACCFITLTYAETDGDLHPEDLTKFLKRLRKAISPVKIRYFACGEYGSKGKRPHYHAVIFGYDFPDKHEFRRDKKGFMMCRSALLEKLWPFGISSVLPANMTTFGYVTKDMQKLLPVEDKRVKPFIRMSNRPGIGANGWNRSLTDGKLWHDGQSIPLPRYYKKLAEREELPGLRDVQRWQVLYADNIRQLKDPKKSLKKSQKYLEKLLTN
nr:replication initiation protein [Microvirus sp.]